MFYIPNFFCCVIRILNGKRSNDELILFVKVAFNSWEDVRHVAINETSKWFETDMFAEGKQRIKNHQASEEIELEKDEFYQSFFMMKKVRLMDEMTLIKLYELHYIDRAFFLEQILGCGQRTVAE